MKEDIHSPGERKAHLEEDLVLQRIGDYPLASRSGQLLALEEQSFVASQRGPFPVGVHTDPTPALA